jgi:Neuraminidase (sialidase)
MYTNRQNIIVIALVLVGFSAFTGAAEVSDAVIKNVIVHYEKGRFCGWPANYGTWSWGNEILVGFKFGYYQAKDRGHSYDREKPMTVIMSRSLDGGLTWKPEEPKNINEESEPVDCPGGINFEHPDFALRCRKNVFNYSYDRGKTWSVPYKIPPYGQKKIMARTDYIVNGKDDCFIFMTASKTNGKEGRPFCVRTTNGGKKLDWVSWIGPEPEGFSIMPQTVRVSRNKLVTAIRRKEEGLGFIDVYGSQDNGRTWQFLNKPCETGRHNGNPADLNLLKDGRIVMTYGDRSAPQGIRAVISKDNGKTWSDEIFLRVDGRTWDIGYPQTILRPDGKLVTFYYYTTKEHQEMHIGATIWDPDKME